MRVEMLDSLLLKGRSVEKNSLQISQFWKSKKRIRVSRYVIGFQKFKEDDELYFINH